MSKKFLIVDGFSLAYRAFYAFPPNLTFPDGQPSNAVYGFLSLLFNCMDQFKPDHVCICLDRKEPTFRHKMYKEYKAHRPPAPVEFSSQIPYLYEVLKKLGLNTYEMAGFEADDIIGTLARQADEQAVDSYIMTGDLDSLQLVTDRTKVVTQRKGETIIYTPEMVLERYEIPPDKIVDMKAMKGDSSDNIPGVKGVGEKTAIMLLKEYGDLDTIYENVGYLKSNSVRAKLTTDKEMAYISQTLATIDVNVPVQLTMSDNAYTPDWVSIIDTFEEYEFKNLTQKYKSRIGQITTPLVSDTPCEDSSEESPEVVKKAVDGIYQCIESVGMLERLLPLMKDGFAIDLETTGKNAVGAQIVGIAISMSAGKGYYIPLNKHVHETSEMTQTIPLFDTPKPIVKLPYDKSPILTLLQPILEDSSIPKYTHHGKYEMGVLLNYGIQLRGIAFDTLLAAFLLYPQEPVGLKALVGTHLGIEMQTFESVMKESGGTTFNDVDINLATQYGAADADFTYRLRDLFFPLIEDQYKTIFYDIELPTQDVLAQMEWDGVAIDLPYLGTLHSEFSDRVTTLEKEIHDLAGEPFNLASPKQLSEILFGKLGLPVIKKTKTGISTDSSVLEKLSAHHPIAQKMVAYRTLTKLLSTYVDALPKMVLAETGMVHTHFNQTVTATGRLSSTNPNLQNIPIRTEEGGRLRHAFISSFDNGSILSVDYSQIELRVLAHLSKDPNMTAAFQADRDIHRATAALVYNVDYEMVSKEQRGHAKAINFGITYGQGAFALADQLGILRKEAQAIIDAYYDQFSTIKDFIEDTKTYARDNGMVATDFGRQRPLPEILSTNKQRIAFSERIAVNTRVQGTAADIMKMAMIKVATAMDKHNFESKLIIQVHDELVFDVKKEEVESLTTVVKQEMESVVDWPIPLKVDVACGTSWAE